MGTHVLVPVDGSKSAWEALEHAVTNVAENKLTVLHVVDPAEQVYAGTDGGYFDAEGFARVTERGEELCEQARERLREDGSLEGIDVETVVESGKPAQTIVEYAADNDVDHVVMGSHGRTGISRILLGSVAETVTRRSPVPVTIIR